MEDFETYPGTDLVVRFCYGCQTRIDTIDDGFVDQDEDVVVCRSCKNMAESEYPGQTSIVPMREMLTSLPDAD